MSENKSTFIQFESEEDRKYYYKRYGKYIPLGGKPGQPLFLIGPDWKFFVGMFSFLALVGITSCVICFLNQKSLWAFFGSMCVTILELLVYGLTTFKDPGIVQEQEVDIEEYQQNEQIFCNICKVHKKKGRFHCPFCDVCIDGHDHHCPWTSKCIGKGNLILFYLFLVTTSLFFIYHILISLNSVLKYH